MNYNIKISKYGTKRYYVNEQLHREDGPAEEYPNGSKYWYLNGERHRDNGPAYEFFAHKEWYKNNKLHREEIGRASCRERV